LFVADAYNQLVRKIINLNIQSVSLQLINGNTTTICEGDTISFRAVPEIYNSYEFLIDGNVVQTSVSEFFSTASLASGTYFLAVRAINNTGGVITSPDIFVQVLAKPTPSIIIVGDTTFFDGDSVQLIASAGSGYLWNTGATTGSIKVFNTGKYWVDVTNSNGCVGRSDTISVNVIQFSPDPVINIIEGAVSVSPDGSTGTVCFGNAALLRSSFNAGNQWFKDGFPIMGATDFEYLATESGAYQVEVTDNLGFILFSNTIDIVALPKQINDFTAVPTNPRPNQTVTFTANLSPQVTSQLWSFGVGNSVANTRSATFAYANTGNYTVRLTTADLIGCTDTLTKLNYITVAENGGGGIGVGDDEIFIPTAFSPNGDGNNDIFYVRGGDITALSLSIYNQWGERLFFSTQQTDGWDGSYNGQQVQIGTYTYIAKITTKDNAEQTFKGHVSVLR
jgi:gliding motility-associated-like protein